MRSRLQITVLLVAVLGLGACGNSGEAPGKESAGATPPTNRIELPASVRQNLGITWAKARRGRLTRFYSVPGEIIARPDHSWALHAPLPGAVTSIARRWQAVKAGDVVAVIASPVLAEWQAELHAGRAQASEARMALSRARAEVAPGRVLADTLARVAKDAGEAVTRSQRALEDARRVADAADVRLAEVLRLRESGAVSAAAVLSARRDALALKRGVNEAARVLRVTRVEAA